MYTTIYNTMPRKKYPIHMKRQRRANIKCNSSRKKRELLENWMNLRIFIALYSVQRKSIDDDRMMVKSEQIRIKLTYAYLYIVSNKAFASFTIQ